MKLNRLTEVTTFLNILGRVVHLSFIYLHETDIFPRKTDIRKILSRQLPPLSLYWLQAWIVQNCINELN